MAPLNKLETAVMTTIMPAFFVFYSIRISFFLFQQYLAYKLRKLDLNQFPLSPTAIYNHSQSSS